MRKWIDIISEAPIGNIDALNIQDTGSFTPTDQKIIQSPKAEAKIRRVLARIPQTIDIMFRDTGAPITDVLKHADEVGGVFTRAALNLPPPAKPDTILLILTNNEGFKRVQLSPWIIMHRLAHGIAVSESSQEANILFRVMLSLQEIFDILRSTWMISNREAAYALGSMKSARERKLSVPMELIMEMFAQYCVTGKVTLNRITTEWLKQFSDDPTAVNDTDCAYVNNYVEDAEKDINNQFERLMKMLEGKVVIL